MKASWCPVCVNQFRRLSKHQRRLAACGLRFIVLSTGPKKLQKITAKRRWIDGLYIDAIKTRDNVDLQETLHLKEKNLFWWEAIKVSSK